MRTELRVGLVELYATNDGSLFGPRMRDLYSVVHLPSRAIELLAAILRESGFANVKTFNPFYNRFRGRFHAEELRELAGMDVVGLSAITRTQPPSYELAARLKAVNPGLWVVLGGPHVTAHPEEGLRFGDVVVRREGDRTLPELLDRIAANRESPSLEDLPGISFRAPDGRFVHNPERPFLSSEELSGLPFPHYPEPVRKGISHSVIVTSRGCPFHCDFCAVITHFGSRYRYLGAERAVELIEHTLRQVRKPIFFGDDNFHALPARTRAILETLLRNGIRMPPWGAQVRVEAAADREMLGLMRKAGCERLYVGFESVNDRTLKLFHKQSSREKNEAAIHRFHEAGFSLHGMFVLGSDEDTVETVRETLRFAKRTMLDTAQFFSLTPLPGTPLTDRYRQEGKILSQDWSLYDAHHVTVRPVKIEPHVLQRELTRAHLRFYSWKEAFRHLLFSKARLSNAIVRVVGNALSRRIRRQLRPYNARLALLQRWTDEVEGRYQRLRRQLGDKVQSLGKGLSQSTAPVRASAEEFVRWLRASLERIPQEFIAYGQRYVAFRAESALRPAVPEDRLSESLPRG